MADMIITLETHGVKHVIETDHDEHDRDDVLYKFLCLMDGAGFHTEDIKKEFELP